ncbi:hypothetical protein [Treponema putidum]|uniref:Uncharacterized protein n=1 Tax=Treponema putidum TaxID=221027 RepID=A0ABY5HY62_9SPIR|nr:hypothetical protein [Treponema putidum]UTY29489.1 hypothetical protein E4N76_11345 [Treponema putidum]
MEILQTEIGRVYADIVGKTEADRSVYSILSVPYAQGKRFEYAKILDKKDYSPETIINRTETLCFPQRKYPLFLNVFMKHHMLRIDKMNIPVTDENKAAVSTIQKDWIQFIKFGKIDGCPLFNGTGEITEYDKEIKNIPFPHENLIHHIQKSGIADKLRKEYIQNRR